MHILLIEPDIKLGKVYSRFFEITGHEVSWRLTAQSALYKVDESKPDVIMLELQLPVHNGIEFLYEFRSYADWRHIPVIINSQVPPVLKAVSPMLWEELGVVSYHYKPATKLRDLLKTVESTALPV